MEDQKSPDLEGTGELIGAPDQNEAAEPPSDTKVDPTDESNAEPFDDFQAEMERLAELSEDGAITSMPPKPRPWRLHQVLRTRSGAILFSNP